MRRCVRMAAMNPERWRQIDDLYHQALERDPGQRSAFLADACQANIDLRRQVEVLLSQTGSTGSLVANPVWEVVAGVAETSARLTPGTRIGPYEILGPLGAGGMGTVYRALDTRLDRAVAIKVSAEQFSARFEREARAISALNHPNICTLYDVGPNSLVMELVQGETLAQRIHRTGPLPLKEALDVSLQVAEALEAAHAKGIIHRDLKPANVKLTPEGRVKVLDFGLAKTVRDERADASVSVLTSVTGTGSLGQAMGTPAYMSPEQARGGDIDAGTDVWAFACLIYELLTGQHAFHGETGSETISAVLEKEPDWHALPSTTPARLRGLLRQCLEKDAIRRQHDLRVVRKEIENAAAPRKRALTLVQPAALGALLAGMGLAVWFLRGPKAPTDETIHAVPLTTYPGTQDWPSFSPDGNRVAFAWDGEKQDNFDIYVKAIGPAPPLRVTHDPAADMAPAWSPDGKMIAFLRASRPGKSSVVLVSPQGGPERVVDEVMRFEPMNQGLGWSPDSKGVVVFDRPIGQPPGLWLLSVENSERRRLTAIADEGISTGDFPGDFTPAVAPDGRTLAFRRAVTRNAYDLFLLPLARGMRPAGHPRPLTKDNRVILGLGWTADGKDLVISAGTPGNVPLFRIRASGEGLRPLTQEGEILNLTVAPRSNRLVFSRSRREMDIYRAEMSGAGSEVHNSIPLIASSRLERYPSYSPDGKKIAFVSLRSGNWQLWVSSSDGENAQQMTSFGPGEVAMPAWSPDGTQIGFTSNAEGVQQAYTVDAAGGRTRKLEALGKSVFNFRWSRDERWIFVLAADNGNLQLFKAPAAGGAPTQMTREGAGTIAESFDGKLVYYIRPGGVWCVPVEGGPEQLVFKADINPGVLEADRRGVYFTTKSTPTKNGDLMFYPFPKGPVTRIAGVETRYGISLSPDGRYLVYTKLTTTGSDLMLVENFR